MTIRSTKTPTPRPRPATAAKAVKRASASGDKVVRHAIKLVDEVATEATAASGRVIAANADAAIERYEDAAARTRDGANEIVNDADRLLIGATDIHRVVWTSVQRQLRASIEMPVEFASCTSFTELAEKQRDAVLWSFNEWLNVSQEILMAGKRIADQAVNALELR